MTSFGFSIGDIVSLLQLTMRAYPGWKNACGESTEITKQLNSMNVLVKRLKDEVEALQSLLRRGGDDHAGLTLILNNSRATVMQLKNIISKYKSLAWSRKSNWDRIRFGKKDLGQLRCNWRYTSRS